jgi:hypothetical protein
MKSKNNFTKINYIVEVNGKAVKSGWERIDMKKLQDFERKLIAEYTKRPGKDEVIIKFR